MSSQRASQGRSFSGTGGRDRRQRLGMVALLAVALGLACGESGPMSSEGPQATVALVSPMGALGLHYGEQATLLLRYRHLGQGIAGTTLSLHIDSDNTGTTLSADRVVTNDRGEASVLLTAGAAEAAFHVLVSAPLANELVIDIAVSRYAFGNLDVSLDASDLPGVTMVRAALVTGVGAHCAALLPTAKLGPVLRSQQANKNRGVLPFSTLLVQPYSVLGRAEDSTGRLLGYGCVELSDDLLRTGLRAVVPVPLGPVFPSPLGRYDLAFELKSKPSSPALWELLACAQGLGQVLIDAMLPVVPTADKDVATRLTALRGALDTTTGCRTGTDKPDDKLHALLAGTAAGTALVPVAQDAAAIVGGLKLATLLQVYVSNDRDTLATHTLTSATLATSTRSANYSLATVPVPAVTNLLLTQNGVLLTIPEHALTLRLPSLWRQAMSELVIVPRSLTMTPAQLFQAAVTMSVSSGKNGCDAVEALLCSAMSPPCTGKLSAACLQATSAIASSLTRSFDDAMPDYDLWLSLSATMEDPDGTLETQTFDDGQVSGRVLTGSGLLTLSGTATGARR